jgi:hypothetical protein
VASVIDARREAEALLDKLGESLREQGLTLEEIIGSGRAERSDLLREMYGIEPKESSDTTPVKPQ